MPSSHLSLDAEASSDDRPQLKEKMSVLDHAVKVRKPYTITKQRERWTEDEHSKFLDAMKMHGRAWRQIEDHVGTKTAVQIRSHAQKFFTKVVRESAGDSIGEAKTVEIPPPRPKKKPAHPYPRKLGSLPSIRVSEKQEWSLIQKLPVTEQTVTEQDNPLETPVLSAVGSDASSELVNMCTSPDSSVVASDPAGAPLSEQENRCQSATTSVENGEKPLALHDPNMELDLGSDDSVSGVECAPVEVPAPAPAPAACLKLFGKMVVMADPPRPPCATIGDAERCPETCSASTGLEGHCESEDISQHVGQLNSWPSGMTPMLYLLPSSLQNSSDAGAVHMPWMWAFYGGAAAPLSFNSEQDRLPSFGESFDNSSAGPASGVELSIGGRSTNSTRDQHCTLRLRPSEKSAFKNLKVTTSKPAKGFMPYKRCVPAKKADNQRVVVMVDDGGEEQGVRLCL